ncbi:PREDICTED: protein C8orf37-like [Amphimedon queenslandica]|uniref:Cilia- and flagella-associated protein 418 n=1 Tax=Amphimedon queenslandica TaxID=400682 RepID=A0AAN0JMT2_AMPQE|nr:PREDICTED: protein C8orf37-like [Amphimedon queenslandica]|eukprot:XP_019858089.1 PREDICTED: protein C8orf37-like [Amphimedon queenslandica]
MVLYRIIKMADDFDELLNEVETSYCPVKEPQKRLLPSDKYSRDIDTEIDELLDIDEGEVEGGGERAETKDDSVFKIKTKQATNGRKCHPVLIGGSGIELKYNDNKNHGCDQLRCLSCDSSVLSFNNYSWIDDVEYLFFRNNYPNNKKLKTKLVYSEGYRSYACQCSWIHVNKLVNINNMKSLKWTCGRH